MGTLINVLAIIAGGICGLLFGNRLPQRFRTTLMQANGIAVMFLGTAGALEKMLQVENGKIAVQGSMMMIISLALGSVIGEWIDIDSRMETFGEWLKQKSGSGSDSAFVSAFVTASLTVCIGAMAVVGSIQDGITGDYSVLAAKAVLDFIIIMVMTASLGKGALFSAVPVGILQGAITLLARFIAPLITTGAMNNLSLVGSVLIFCVGVNLIFNIRIRVANMLPSLVIAAVFAVLP
ncbi:MAG: DUF554 domain-containing protein [Solobacterium sp.]|nr:DUF554 domain-containing protein [Solobacterium sp.]